MRKILTDKTCEYFNNLRVLLKHGLKPELKRSRVRELTTLVDTHFKSQQKLDLVFWMYLEWNGWPKTTLWWLPVSIIDTTKT